MAWALRAWITFRARFHQQDDKEPLYLFDQSTGRALAAETIWQECWRRETAVKASQ